MKIDNILWMVLAGIVPQALARSVLPGVREIDQFDWFAAAQEYDDDITTSILFSSQKDQIHKSQSMTLDRADTESKESSYGLTYMALSHVWIVDGLIISLGVTRQQFFRINNNKAWQDKRADKL